MIIFYLGQECLKDLMKLLRDPNSSIILGYNVRNPSGFGVANFSEKGELLQLLEKPKKPPSNIAVVGLYKFPPDAFYFINDLKKVKK